MEQVASVLEKILPQQGRCEPTLPRQERSGLSRELTEMVWSWMASSFGHKWVSSFGAEVDPDEIWRATLAGLDFDALKNGMRRLAESGSEWPPSAPEFRAMCQPQKHWEHAQLEAADRAWRERQRLMLEHSATVEARHAEGKAALSNIKNFLRGAV